MTRHSRVAALTRRLADAACPRCGRPFSEAPPLPPITPTAEMDRVFLPILMAIVSRIPPAPDACPACRRPPDPDGWEWSLRFATAGEKRALQRAVDRFAPSGV